VTTLLLDTSVAWLSSVNVGDLITLFGVLFVSLFDVVCAGGLTLALPLLGDVLALRGIDSMSSASLFLRTPVVVLDAWRGLTTS
jgi:hypothetical protein